MSFQGFPSSNGPPIQSQGADFTANNKPNPGFLAQGTEQGALWGGWREVAGSYWTLQNADFIGGQWQQLNQSVSSWALALLSGGGFAMFFSPAISPTAPPTSPIITWQTAFAVNASGQITTGGGSITSISPTVDLSALSWYNYLNFGAIANAGISTQNNTALTNMFARMVGANAPATSGGRAFIPAGSFLIDVSTNGYTVPNQAVIEGSGPITYGPGSSGSSTGNNNTQNCMFLATLASASSANIMFNMAGNHSWGGTTIRYIGFGYPAGSNASSVCINMSGIQPHVENCSFYNCPQAIVCQGLHGIIRDCTFEYQLSGSAGPNGGSTPGTAIAQIQLDAPQCKVIDCEMQQNSITGGGPTGIAGVSMNGTGGAGEHNAVIGCHLSDFSYGITFAIGANQMYHCEILRNEIPGYITSLYLQPGGGSNASLFGLKVTDNILYQSFGSISSTPVVFLDCNSAAANNTQLDDIEFKGNTLYNGGTHGYVFGAAYSIRVIGGQSSGHNPTGGAGIAIIPSAATGLQARFITIQNVDLRPRYYNSPQTGARSQQYAIICTANPVQVLVDGCDLTGYGSPITGGSPISITGAPTSFIVINSPGYNDQNVSLNGSPTSVAPTGTAKSAATATVPYYGPSVIKWDNAGTPINVTFGATTISASSGYYYLASPYDTILFASAPATFAWIGK